MDCGLYFPSNSVNQWMNNLRCTNKKWGKRAPIILRGVLRCNARWMNTDLARVSMAAVETTWLSPRFDRMNVLSKAIKVSPVFARRDGWRFDDHEEKQYIDPELTVIPVIWRIFPLPLLLLKDDRFFVLILREEWKQTTYKTDVYFISESSQERLSHNLWNIQWHYCTHKNAKRAVRPFGGGGAFSSCILIGCRHTHPYVLSRGRPFPQGFPHVSTACLPWLYLQSKTPKRVH